ncbi:MAG: DNA polymerase III subunit gamma/tau [Polyangia bacterium]
MSYLVLARKYRPQTFSEIVGQEHVTDTLKSAIAQGRLHHAFLFCGARGVGKTTAARILAKALSCENGPAPEPCNHCEACREITNGSSVDVQEIDAASNNGVDNIRELRDAIRYAPVRGKKKVYILDEVHMLSSGAWNALLKTLEEPPPHAVFVFATTDPHKLPATILSRVQRYNFKLVPVRRVAEHLADILGREGLTAEPAALTLIARESGGSIRDGLSLVDQILAGAWQTLTDSKQPLTEARVADLLGVADRALVSGIAASIIDRQPDVALRLVDDAFRNGYDLVQLAHTLLGVLRDLVVVAAVKEPGALIDGGPGELEVLSQLAARSPKGLAEILFQRFSRTTEQVARASTPRHVLEVGLVELCWAEPLEPISGLLDRLLELEGALADGGPPPPRVQRTVETSPGTEVPRVVDAPRGEPPSTPTARAPQRAPQNFTELVEAVLSRSPRLSVLSQGRCVEFTPEKLTLAFDREFDADGMRERMEVLRGVLTEVLGKAPDVEITVGSHEDVTRTETLIEVEARKVVEDREVRRRESIDHPVRKALDERFGGTWKEPVVDLDKE